MKNFIKTVDRACKKSGIPYNKQGDVMRKLFQIEKEIQEEISLLPDGSDIFRKFHIHITSELGNILKAKPFFRVREKEFNKTLSGIFATCDFEKIKNFPMNFIGINFLMQHVKKEHEEIHKKFKEYSGLREKLIESNLPLAINRALKFSRQQHNRSMSVLDCINIASMGLAMGVDKYCGDFSNVFRSVLIGQMTRLLIESNTQSMIKVPSGDKKILYRINILKFRKGITSTDEICEKLNEWYQEDKSLGKKTPPLPIKKDKIEGLMLSVDNGSVYQDYAQETSRSKDTVNSALIMEDNYESYENFEEKAITSKLIKELTIKERKLLKLKGVTL